MEDTCDEGESDGTNKDSIQPSGNNHNNNQLKAQQRNSKAVSTPNGKPVTEIAEKESRNQQTNHNGNTASSPSAKESKSTDQPHIKVSNL
jgi:hypothetical protein